MTARLVVMASGNGSNLQALLDACELGKLPAKVVGVVTNKPDAFALRRAAESGVPSTVLSLKPWLAQGQTRPEYDAALAEIVLDFNPDLVVLAGWMLVLGERFLQPLAGRVLNVHPALPGALPGKDAIRRAWEAFQHGKLTHTGVMVHEGVLEVDAGPVLATEQVALAPDEPLELLEARMHAVEHRVLVQGVLRALELRKLA